MTKIAVPYDNGEVFGHFGRSVRFLICEIDGKSIVNENVVDVDTPGSGSGVADFLARSGVNTVVCSGMGEGARGHLSEHGIEVVTGASGKAVDAVKAYLDGTLVNDPSLIHGEGRCGCRH